MSNIRLYSTDGGTYDLIGTGGIVNLNNVRSSYPFSPNQHFDVHWLL